MILAVSMSQNPPSPADGYRGRFAPSPTGPLHAGSLVAALGSWLDARKNGGKWLLRIEDLDSPRCVPGAEHIIQSQLLACGLFWDEEVVFQSARQDVYQSALERLGKQKLLYPCTCSRQTISNTLASLNIQTPRHQEMIYPGTCRPLAAEMQDHHQWNAKVAWRIALPNHCRIRFEDGILGSQEQDLCLQVGDFVLRRSDGVFTYQLAVVVDDALQGITHIVRGADLLSNTARQIFLQEQFGFSTPFYKHLPLVLDEHGDKLSKQTLATQINTRDQKSALMELRKAGKHLGLQGLPTKETTTIAEWLLAATQAWRL